MFEETKRETLIVYGDCQAFGLIRVLCCIRAVVERFELRFHRIDEQASHYLQFRDEIMAASLVLLQDLDSLESYPFKHLSYDLRPPSLLFPRLAFAPLWPFSFEFAGRDKVAEQLFAERGNIGMNYFDTLLGLLRIIPDKSVRYSCYRELQPCNQEVETYLKRRDVQRIFELECWRLHKLDRQYELVVGEFIIMNFRSKRLFHTVKHPTVELIYVMATQLLDKLNLQSDLCRPLIDSLDYYQIPVHPSVAKNLEVSWATPDLTYTVLGEQVTFESYAKRYIEEFG